MTPTPIHPSMHANGQGWPLKFKLKSKNIWRPPHVPSHGLACTGNTGLHLLSSPCASMRQTKCQHPAQKWRYWGPHFTNTHVETFLGAGYVKKGCIQLAACTTYAIFIIPNVSGLLVCYSRAHSHTEEMTILVARLPHLIHGLFPPSLLLPQTGCHLMGKIDTEHIYTIHLTHYNTRDVGGAVS